MLLIVDRRRREDQLVFRGYARARVVFGGCFSEGKEKGKTERTYVGRKKYKYVGIQAYVLRYIDYNFAKLQLLISLHRIASH